MEKKSFEQLVDIYEHNSKVGKERSEKLNAQEEIIENLRRKKRDEIWVVEKRYDKKINNSYEEKNKLAKEFDAKVISKQDLETKIKLRVIVDHLLTDASCSYGYGQWKKEDVVGEIDGNLFTVTILIEENNNKANNFTLRYFVGFKYYYLSEYFNDILVGCYNLCQRTFKSKKDALEYSGKNSNKIMSPLWSKENFLFRSIKGFEYDVLKGFDFRGVQRSVSGETMVVTSKTEATFSTDYDRNPIKVKYVGGGEFIVDTKDKEFIKRFTSQIEWGKICRIPESLIKITIAVTS